MSITKLITTLSLAVALITMITSIQLSTYASPTDFNDSDKFYCQSPDNFNWCQNSDHRITGGWKKGDTIGFLWNAPAGGTFPYTYVDAAFV